MAWLNLFGKKVKAKDVTDGSGKTPILTYQPFKLLYQGTWAKGATKSIPNADKYKLFCIYVKDHAIVLLGCKEPQGITLQLPFMGARDTGTASFLYKITFNNVDTNNWTMLGASFHQLNTNGNAGGEIYGQTLYIYGIF